MCVSGREGNSTESGRSEGAWDGDSWSASRPSTKRQSSPSLPWNTGTIQHDTV